MDYNLDLMPITDVCLNVTEACNLMCRYCIAGDTIINLKDGTAKPIKDIHEGDIILGCEEDAPGGRKQRTVLESIVLKTFSRQVNSILEIEFNDGRILHITDNHPVLNGRGEWTQAKNLRESTGMVMSIGVVPDRVIDIYNLDYITIKSVKTLTGDFTVYNLETSTHTYLANGCVVHNCFTEHHPNFMTLDVAKDAARWLYENSKIASDIKGKEVVPHIGFFGGEPTLMWDSIVVPLVEWIKAQGWNFSYGITSNCVLMDKDKVDFLCDNGIGLLCSIDGAEYSQNYNRPCKDSQANSFELVSKNLPYIVKRMPGLTFRSTITPATADRVFENIMYAGSLGFNMVFSIINTFEPWPEEARHKVEQQIQLYSLYVIECCREGVPFVRFRPWEQAINKIVTINTTKVILGDNLEYIGPAELSKCGLGNGYGSINYKGDIFSCQEVASREGEKNKFYIGNIYTGIDADRLYGLREEFSNRAVKNYNFDHPEKCPTCKLRKVCKANLCQINNYILYKDFSANADSWCWWNNLLRDSVEMTMQILGYHKNDFFWHYLEQELISQGGPFHAIG